MEAVMYILRIEHPIADFDGWKRAFDGDPSAGRSGRRYRVSASRRCELR
jgi:hypothetical protein